MTIILASSSPYRHELMKRLGLPFQHQSPHIIESRINGETPEQMVQRLAKKKAEVVAKNHQYGIVIGSDQVVVLGDEILMKPVTHEKAKSQLNKLSNRCVKFITGLAVINISTQTVQTDLVYYNVHFRELDNDVIERYLELEQPYDCAGSFKSEALGISLISSMEGDDPTALIGLPLIRLCEMLRNEGIQIP